MTEPEHFNRVLRRFRDDLPRPAYAERTAAIDGLVARMRERDLPLRLDFGRAWENAHVLIELDRIEGAGRVLDVGGGNGPLAYHLAERGHEVVVLELDREAVARIGSNAAAMGLSSKLRAVHGGVGTWPLPDGSFDAAISVSVLEGLLRSQRAEHFAELRRVLRPGGHLLLTFDYGEGARLVGDPPTTADEVARDVVGASGLHLVGEPFHVPELDPELGPPVKVVVPTVDGYDCRVAEYSFGAVHLAKD